MLPFGWWSILSTHVDRRIPFCFFFNFYYIQITAHLWNIFSLRCVFQCVSDQKIKNVFHWELNQELQFVIFLFGLCSKMTESDIVTLK